MSDHQHPDDTLPSGSEEHGYLLRRAADHRRLAEQSDPSGSRPIHLRLQQLYEDRAARIVMVVPD